MTPEPAWLKGFLARYIATIAPHDWPDGTMLGEWEAFIEGWAYAFALPHPPIAEAEADAARVRLAMSPPAFRRDHLPAVVAVVLGMRERETSERLALGMAEDPAEVAAKVRSRGCPECSREGQPTGWAGRRAVWSSPQWMARLDLFCRCPLGRLRLHDLNGGFDDLQAWPELWDPALSHKSWPPAPASRDGRPHQLWRYLAPGEPAPEPLEESLRKMTRSLGSRKGA